MAATVFAVESLGAIGMLVDICINLRRENPWKRFTGCHFSVRIADKRNYSRVAPHVWERADTIRLASCTFTSSSSRRAESCITQVNSLRVLVTRRRSQRASTGRTLAENCSLSTVEIRAGVALPVTYSLPMMGTLVASRVKRKGREMKASTRRRGSE